MMSRAWERGRLARIAGKDRKANPYGRRRRENVQWLAGWLYQDERCTVRFVNRDGTEAGRIVGLASPPEALYRCAGSRCPGLPYPASQTAHPASCVGPDGR